MTIPLPAVILFGAAPEIDTSEFELDTTIMKLDTAVPPTVRVVVD